MAIYWESVRHESKPTNVIETTISEIQICKNLPLKNNEELNKNNAKPRKAWITKETLLSCKIKKHNIHFGNQFHQLKSCKMIISNICDR